MKQFTLSLLVALSSLAASAQQPLMRDVFAAMPDSVLPMVSKNNRLDCIDFIENQMEARVRNAIGEYVTLEALTKDYLRFRTSSAALLEMKLLPTSDSTAVLCLVHTVQTGAEGSALRMEDSHLRFLRPDWSELPSQAAVAFSVPDVSAFVKADAPDSLRADFEQAQRSLQAFHPVRMAFSSDDAVLTLTLQTALLSMEEKRAVEGRLQSVVRRWNGTRFE